MRPLLLFVVGAALLSAQEQPVPAYNEDTSISYFQAEASQTAQQTAGAFLDIADGLANKLGVALFVFVLFFTGLSAFTGHGNLNYERILVEAVIPFIVVKVLLFWWVTPCPWMDDNSFSGLWFASGNFLTHHIEAQMKPLSLISHDIKVAIGPEENIFSSHWFSWQVLNLAVGLLRAPQFFVVAQSVVAVSMGMVVGPIFLLARMVPSFGWMWSGWKRAMTKYTLYPVFIAIFIAVSATYFAGLIRWFCGGGTFTLDTLAPKAITIVVMICAYVYIAFHVPHIVDDFTSGASGTGHGVVRSVAYTVRGWVR